MRFPESINAPHPAQKRMLLGLGFRQLGLTPRRGEHGLDVVEEKIDERDPCHRPANFVSNGYEAVSLSFKRNDRPAQTLHEPAAILLASCRCVSSRSRARTSGVGPIEGVARAAAAAFKLTTASARISTGLRHSVQVYRYRIVCKHMLRFNQNSHLSGTR